MCKYQSSCSITHNGGLGKGAVLQDEVYTISASSDCREMFFRAVSLFYHLLYQLEDDGLLDSCNYIDLYLHYVLISRINHQLNIFRHLYSHRPLCTAKNLTPLKLWIRGLTQRSGDCAALQGALDDPFVRNYNVIVLFLCVVMSLLASLC